MEQGQQCTERMFCRGNNKQKETTLKLLLILHLTNERYPHAQIDFVWRPQTQQRKYRYHFE